RLAGGRLRSLPAQLHLAAQRTPFPAAIGHDGQGLETATRLEAVWVAIRMLAIDDVDPRVVERRNSVKQRTPKVDRLRFLASACDRPQMRFEHVRPLSR